MDLKLAFTFWAVMLVFAVANGIFGEMVVSRAIGDYGAHLYKTFFIIAVILISSNIYMRKTGGADWLGIAVSTGFLWITSSIVFEFIFGHYVFGFPWEKLTADYRIWEGRLWSLVLAAELIGPAVNGYFLYGGK